MTDPGTTAHALRSSEVAAAIRRERLVVVLRRVAPQERLVALVCELADAGARVFEVTFDAPSAGADLVACREALAGSGAIVGAGTLRSDRRARRRGGRRSRVRREPGLRSASPVRGALPRPFVRPRRLQPDRDRRCVERRGNVREALPSVVGRAGSRPGAPRPDGRHRADPDRRDRRHDGRRVPGRGRRRGRYRGRDRQRLGSGAGGDRERGPGRPV